MSETVKGEQYYIGDGENQFKDLKPAEDVIVEVNGVGYKTGSSARNNELNFISDKITFENSKPLFPELENIKNIIAGLQQQIEAMQCCGNCAHFFSQESLCLESDCDAQVCDKWELRE